MTIRRFLKALLSQSSNLVSKLFYLTEPFPTDSTATSACEITNSWRFTYNNNNSNNDNNNNNNNRNNRLIIIDVGWHR